LHHHKCLLFLVRINILKHLSPLRHLNTFGDYHNLGAHYERESNADH
jgi:hypothetical protein